MCDVFRSRTRRAYVGGGPGGQDPRGRILLVVEEVHLLEYAFLGGLSTREFGTRVSTTLTHECPDASRWGESDVCPQGSRPSGRFLPHNPPDFHRPQIRESRWGRHVRQGSFRRHG
jgi:hypothetical protein